MAELLVAERYERIEVALTGYHLVGDDRGKEQNHAGEVSPELEECCQDQIDQSEELDRVTELITGMCIVCDGDEGHI